MAQLILTDPPLISSTPSPEPAPPRRIPTAAEDLAAANLSANVRALSLTQPHLVDAAISVDVDGLTWTFARDGSLTAFDEAGRWWDGCSVPLRAARAMLKTLDPRGRVACFLRPTQAAHLRVALEMLRPDQAVIAIIPEASALGVMLRSMDFSDAITCGRLWFASGGQWPLELARVFQDNPGLATPSQFVRLPITPADEVERLVATAQGVFAEQNTARAAAIATVRETAKPAAVVRQLCVLAPSNFQLWEEAGSVLAGVVHDTAAGADVDVVRFDADLPRHASLLALATAAASCDALLTAIVGRADLPDVAPRAIPWLTWVTTPRIPSGRNAGPRDALLLADPSWRAAAQDAGWSADGIHLAPWPYRFPHSGPLPAGSELAIVADTCATDPPERLSEFSSHLLLWERLRSDIAADPFRVGDDAEQFLDRMLRQFGVSGESFDRRLFVDRLIVPAYQQGLAALLIREKLPLRLFGEGWETIDAFAAFAAGKIGSARFLRRVAREAAAFVHAWPGSHAHPIDALGRPVVRRRDSAGRTFVSDAMRALGAQQGPARSDTPPISLPLVLRVLGGGKFGP